MSRYLWVAITIILTLVCYWPALHGTFIFDDNGYRLDHPLNTAADLYRVWFTTNGLEYWPIFYTLLWFERHIWDTVTWPYHVITLTFHLANCFVLFRILSLLKTPWPWLLALIFAIHPINVEAVAWMIQVKTTLSGFFFFLAILFFIKFLLDETKPNKNYYAALSVFFLALLTKVTVVILPLVLLLIILWRNQKISKDDFKLLAPFFLLSLVFGILGVWYQNNRAMGPEFVIYSGFMERFARIGWIVWFSLIKAVVPINLSFVYPLWKINLQNFFSYTPTLFLFFTIWLLRRFRKNLGTLFYGFSYYLITLIPFSGIFDITYMKYSLFADHYLYLSLPGLFLVLGAVTDKKIAVFLLVPIFCFLTWQLTPLYENEEAIWGSVIRHDSNIWVAHSNIAAELDRQGRFEEAFEHHKEVVRINPDNGISHYDLGINYQERKEWDKALYHYSMALKLHTHEVATYTNLGTLYNQVGQWDLAIENFKKALEIQPDFANAQMGLQQSLKNKK